MNIDVDNGSKFGSVVVDIVKGCNDTCKWCSTGINNAIKGIKECDFEYMPAEEFQKGMEYMKENNIADENSMIYLYNFGEPMLNPELNDILKYISANNYRCTLSTNASKYVEIDKGNIGSIQDFYITVSGFSQGTYQRVQGLKFEQIKSNIERYAKYFRDNNGANKMVLYYLVYQYNLTEMKEVNAFCKENGIRFVPAFGFIADYNLCNSYLEKDNIPEIDIINKEMFTYYVNDVLVGKPADYRCPQESNLVMDHNFNIIPCCRLNTKSVLGNLYSCDLKKIKELKNSTKECNKCMELGQSYIAHNMPSAANLVDIKDSSMTYTFFYNTGDGFSGDKIITKNVSSSEMINTIELEFSEPIKELRFDPIEGSPCVIKKLQIDAGVQAYYEPEAGVITNGEIILLTEDPKLIINFGVEYIKKVKIAVAVARM